MNAPDDSTVFRHEDCPLTQELEWRCDIQATITAFGGGGAPPPSPPPPVPIPAPPPPAIDPDAIKAQQAAAERERLAAGRSRSATILTGPQGDTTGETHSASKKLLGA